MQERANTSADNAAQSLLGALGEGDARAAMAVLDPGHAEEGRTRLALAEHMQRSVRGPLAALRAALEGQRRSASYVDRALGELARVEDAVDDLWRWTQPAALRRTRCCLADLAASVRAGLDERERRRLWILVEQGGVVLETDGPLLVATLRRFVRASLLRAERELLLHAHADDDSVTLSVVDDPPHGEDSLDGDERVDLPLLLGRRDVARLGGTCTVHTTTPQHRCIVLRFPRFGGAS